MIRSALLALALSAASSAAICAPITRQCDYRLHGVGLGSLVLTVDEAALRVVATTTDGVTSTYQDGVTARVVSADEWESLGVVAQFVRFKPDVVEVGFRWPGDGTLGHIAYFNRSALSKLSARCVWHSLWAFRVG